MPFVLVRQLIDPVLAVSRKLTARVPLLAIVTPLGWLVLGTSLLSWPLGARLGWIELILLAATGLFAFLLCGLLTIARMTLRVSVQLGRQRLLAGQSTSCRVEVTNIGRARMLPVEVELPVGRGGSRTFDLPTLAGGRTHAVDFEIHTERRGVIAVGPATTVRGDPLGLLRRAVPWTTVTELFVHPVTVGLESLGAGLLRDLDGYTTNDISTSDLAFHALRDYAPGDDRRHIHWRSSAKLGASTPGGRFQVKQFLDTRRAHLTVVVDGDPSAYRDPGDFETAISAAASVAVRAISDEIDTTVLAAGQVAHRVTRRRALDAFARAEPVPVSLVELAARGARVAPDATVVLIVTGGSATFDGLRRVTGRFAPEVRKLAIQVDPTARAAVSTMPALTLLTIRGLSDLRVVLRDGVLS